MRFGCLVLCMCLSTTAAAQDPLDHVRQLYASADYEGTLTALNQLPDKGTQENLLEGEKYRVLCLVALGRTAEANAVIEQMLTIDPLYDPSAADAPPRVRAAFDRARERILPRVARQSYAAGKAAFDEKAFDRAATKLEETLRLIDGAEAAGEADLADLQTLAKGFLDLSRASIAPVLPASETVAALSTPPADPSPVPPGAPSVVAKRPDSDPVAVQQVLPPWSRSIVGPFFQAEFRGLIEVDIDEAGRVVGAEIIRSIHATYDPALLKAARDWIYQPAYRDGAPARVRKRVEVVLRPR